MCLPLPPGPGWRVPPPMAAGSLPPLPQPGHPVDPRAGPVSARRARPPRPYAIRKPAAYAVTRPGDLVQVDTLDVRPLPGVILKHLAARDMVSRWDVVEVASRATSRTAARFLETLQARMPFPVHAVQVDGGSEFAGAFEQECQRRRIRLFVLPPRSPKLNGRVERSNRTHTEEFYEVTELERTVPAANSRLRQWERIYNTARPSQALGSRTPREFLRDLVHAG